MLVSIEILLIIYLQIITNLHRAIPIQIFFNLVDADPGIDRLLDKSLPRKSGGTLPPIGRV